MKLSIIVPFVNEAEQLSRLLNNTQPTLQRGYEWLFVDGGSDDQGPETLRHAGFRVISSVRGRARQMNAGASAAKGEVLLFLHVDTQLPTALPDLNLALQGSNKVWGRFNVRILGHSRWLIPIAWLMNWRSRLTGIVTGDMALFVSRDAFSQVGGFPEQPLMEDIELSKRLRRLSRPLCLRQRVTTSGRRWDQRGTWRTVLLMWRLRWLYWRGVSPETLARLYQ